MAEEQVKTEEQIRQEVTAELTAQFEQELQATQQRLQEENQLVIKNAIAEWKKEQEPPSVEDISTLLNQEYMTFSIKLQVGTETKEFTIAELPMSAEKRFYKMVKDKLLPKIGMFSTMTLDSASLDQQAQALFDVIDPAMDLLSEVTALVLNPRGQLEGIDSKWVLENVSGHRCWNILHAQMEANRLRDFFSGVSRTSRKGKMMPAVSILN